jgi:hypothetical protein
MCVDSAHADGGHTDALAEPTFRAAGDQPVHLMLEPLSTRNGPYQEASEYKYLLVKIRAGN